MKTFLRFCKVTTIVSMLALSPLLGAAAATMDDLEKQFRELPPSARRWTGPLFWLHGDETRERLESYVDKISEGGNGCFTTESRPHKDWMGPTWYRDLAICLNQAKKRDLKMWIFDEKWWPSGEVAGNVPAQYGSKRLAVATKHVTGPLKFAAPGYDKSNLVAVIAGKEINGLIDGGSLLDLSEFVQGDTLNWQAPEGYWAVMRFSWTNQISGSRYLVDGASQEAVDWYLKTVYQPHYDRFKDDFGRNIMGFFYDEPETQGDWGTEVIKVLKQRGVDWKKALVSTKLKLAGDEQTAARYQYQDAFAEAWGRTMYGGISKWCAEHNVKSIGHFLEHAGLYLRQDLCAGNMFQLQKYSDMGAIDAVFSQFAWGKRAAYDAPCWQTPKLGSSITHAYGKPDDVTMVEIFGARGQDLTYPEMKWWADHMQVSGVNFLIPHSFNPKSPYDTDCPPYFYSGGFEPRWPLYRVFSDYTSRLSVMLTGGHHVCPVALLFVGNSAHSGRYLAPDNMSEALQDALYDCDWLPYDVFEKDMQIADSSLKLRQENYRVLIVPAADVIPQPTLAKAKAFYDKGGIVIGYGFLPTKSATLGVNASEVRQLRDSIWGAATMGFDVCQTNAAGGRSYFLPENPTAEQIQRVLAIDAGFKPTLEVVEGSTENWLHVLHRVNAGRDVFFIANQNLGDAREFRLHITADGEPEVWDAMRNEITALPHTRYGKSVEVTLKFEPNQSTLLVFQPEKRSVPSLLTPQSAATTVITIDRDPAPPAQKPTVDLGPAAALEGASWVWFAEEGPGDVPVGKRYFRKQIELPSDRKIKQASLCGTADNSMALFINGKDVGHSDSSANGWRNPVQFDVTAALKPGANQLAIEANNAGDKPNPAGILALIKITFDEGEPMLVRVDHSWKSAREAQGDWSASGFDDSAWPAAKELAKYGSGPWGRLSSGVTVSPVTADPFVGHCYVSAGIDLKTARVYLEMDALAPEEAARVTVNDRDAGGFIGKPLRLEVTRFLRPENNTFSIEPFAPRTARLLVYP